jgi:uncharacterized membrane protein YfcA
MDWFIILLILLFVLGFLAEFLDAVFGFGFGTFLTPVLILLNLPVIEAVPAILFSQIGAAVATAISFQIHGNVDFSPSSQDSRMATALSISGVFGAVAAILLFYTIVSITPVLIQTYVGLAVILVGLLVVIEYKLAFSWRRIIALGGIAAINKGLTGGGYTPIVAGGQILSGRKRSESIGATTISKAIVSFTAVILYILLGRLIFDPLFLYFTIVLLGGSIVAAPIGSYVVKRTEGRQKTRLVGVVMIFLGIFTLIKAVMLLFSI